MIERCRHKIVKQLGSAVIVLFTLGCKQQVSPAEPAINTFKWLPSESAPKHYPAEIYQGHFITEEGQYITIPNGNTIRNGWGDFGSTWVVGEDFKPVPHKLAIIYISYTEDQFYYGEFDLPTDTITAYFEKGYINYRGEQKSYTTLSAGLAPGGAVSVWLKGAGSTVEIGHYQAEKTEVSMADFNPEGIQDRAAYVKDEQEHFSEETKAVLAKEGIPIGKWTGYRERFRWKPKFVHKAEGNSYRFLGDFYNGEFYLVQPDNPIIATYQDFPPPKRVAFRWEDKNKTRYGCKVYFDEAEIWDVFKRMYSKPETQYADLVLEVDKYNSSLKISLQNETDRIEIEKAKIVMYEASK